jgi:hypothetical protein
MKLLICVAHFSQEIQAVSIATMIRTLEAPD